jgi:hypothetical protein
VIIGTLSACSQGDGKPAGETLPGGTPIAVAPAPHVCLGARVGDPAQEFDGVVTPFLLGRRLVVPLAGSGEIRIFNLQGELLSTLGGAGEGPGEFKALGQAWARGDTIEAFDTRLSRITRFLPGGGIQVIPMEKVPSAQVAVPGSPAFGWVLTGVAEAGMGRRDQVALHRFGRDGSHLDEMGRFEGMARYRVGNFSGPDPLSPKTVVALGGDRIYAGETLTPSMHVFASDGSVEREITWTPDTGLSPSKAYEAVVEAAVAKAGPERARQTRRQLEAFPIASRVSVFWGALVDDRGFLWIRPFDPLQNALALGGYGSPGAGGEWLIFSADGTRLLSVAVPADLEPAAITQDDMVGIRRDGLGVESVCVHPVRRVGMVVGH